MRKSFRPMCSLRVQMVAAISFIASMTFATSTARDYSRLVNTLIGSGTTYGLASGYICPGATYPHGMVQFTPTYFEKNSGFVANQYSGGGCYNLGRHGYYEGNKMY